LSFGVGDREKADTWWRLINELGSIYTNLRGSQISQFTPMDYGKNVLTLSFKQQVHDRLDYCATQIACKGNNFFDEGDITSQRPPEYRCTNMTAYDIYPEDPNKTELAHEEDVCPQALSILNPYRDDPNRGVSQYFIPCNGTNDQLCNQEYDPTFAQAFLALEAGNKARELMVICTDYHRELNHLGEIVLDKFVKKPQFDCQEMLIPPGLVAACQGTMRQYQAWTAHKYSNDIAGRLESELKGVGQLTGEENELLYGPVVKLEPSFWQSIAALIGYESPAFKRLKIYAQRINIENNLCLEEKQEAETFGDTNAQDTKPSSSNIFSAAAEINNPNAEGDDYEQVKRTFIISPPAFSQCLNHLAHTDDNSLTKILTGYREYIGNEGAEKVNHNIPHGLEVDDLESDKDCEALVNGSWIPCSQVPEGVTPEEINERSWKLDYEAEIGENRAYTEGGNIIRYFFLRGLKTMFTSANEEDYAGGIECDWFAYTHGFPISPGCKGSLGDGGPLPPGEDVCKVASSGYCSEEYLSSFLPPNPQYARVASHICRRESGGGPTAINDNCLRCDDGVDNDLDGKIDLQDPDCDSNDGRPVPSRDATADYSVGLFQHNLHPNGLGCPGAWEPSSTAALIKGGALTPRQEFIWCKVKDQAALNTCVSQYQDPDFNIQQMVMRACPGGNCDWSGAWYTNLQCQFLVP
jgi:hypothetical protein